MVGTIEDTYSQHYRAGLMMLAQQKDSRFAGAVSSETGVGKTHYADAIGTTAASEVVGRYGDTPNDDIDHQRTRINLRAFHHGKMLDHVDDLKSLHDHKSKYVMAANAAMNRAKDTVIIGAFFATALRGEEGGTSVSFPAGNQVAVDSWTYGSGSGNAGLTISKLISAKVLLTAGEVDPDEEMFIAFSSKQLGNMLATTEATSADYASVKALVEGRINTFMGFTFIPSERLQVNGSGYRRLPVWQKSGMSLAVGEDITAKVSERADKQYNWQVYNKMFIGAARVEDAKVIEIICAE